MKLNQAKFESVLAKHKKILAGLKYCVDEKGEINHEKMTPKLMALEKTGRELSLAYAGLKCEKCKTDKELQFHHLIMRKVKEYTDFFRYEAQRKYWANILILCGKCHQEIHTTLRQSPKHAANVNPYITEKMIEQVRRKYFIDDKEKRLG